MWLVQGGAEVRDEAAYMTDLIIYADTVPFAVTLDATPIPEFPASTVVAFAVLTTSLYLLRRRRRM